MKVAIDIRDNLEKNAERYFEKSKKARKKLEGAKKALEKTKKRLEEAKEKPVETPKDMESRKRKEREWYEKFHWFTSSDNFLVIGGRDATTNEIVIKKHTTNDDIVLHTDMAGSPFAVIKAEGKDIPESTIDEAASFVLAYSKAWKSGLATAAVFHVKPDQVSKEAKSGEYLPKGAFMIYGDTNYIERPKMSFAVGVLEDDDEVKIMGGPLSAVKAHCGKYVEVVQGKGKTSEAAKYVQRKIGGDLDDIIRVLPAGGVEAKS